MASTSGPGRYPPPVGRDRRTSTNPNGTGPVQPPHHRPGAGGSHRPGRPMQDDFGGDYYDSGRDFGGLEQGGQNPWNDRYDDDRQAPTRHRPISQPLGEVRRQPPFADPSGSSRGVLPLILGGLGLVALGVVGFWLISNIFFGDDGEGGEVAGTEETTTAADGQVTDPAAAEATTSTTAAAAAPADDAQTGAVVEPGPNNRIELTVPMVDILTGNRAATGTIGMTMDRVTGEICFGIETTGIAPPYPAHIHRGELGVKGPIAVDFTPQSDVGLSCTNVPPKNVQAILANPAGYYAEMHDAVNTALTIRGQISEATVTSDPGNIFGAPPLTASSGPPTDPDGGGAYIAIENGSIILRGEVADETAAQQVRDQVSGLPANVLITDELVINPAAPLPSGVFEVSDGIEFDSGSADLSLSSNAVLDVMAALISARPEWSLYITGHTDDVGGDVPNLNLSLQRASSVRDALVARGVAESQLGVLGAGPRQPKVPNDSDANRAKNRRTEFEIDPG